MKLVIDLEGEWNYEESIAEMIRDTVRSEIISAIRKEIKAHKDEITREAQRLIKSAVKEVESTKDEAVKARVRELLKELK